MRQRRQKGRFTTIENEREQQRKLYEENLRKKKDMLYFEFEKQEEVLKYTKLSVESHNDVKFKYEHDRIINLRIEKETQLANLMKKLNDAQEINQMQEPLPEGQSQFGSANKGTNLTSIFSKSYYRSSGLQIIPSSQQRNREDVNNYLAYLMDETEQINENAKNEEQRTHTLMNSMEELFKTKQKYRDQLHDLEFLNDTADRRFHDLTAVQFKAKEKKIAIDKDLTAAKKSLREYQQIGDKYKEKQVLKMKNGEKIKKTAEEIISHDMIRQDELEKENHLMQKQIEHENMKHQAIIQKRNESKYILKYIECFTQYEHLFLNGIKEKEIEELYEMSSINRGSVMNFNHENEGSVQQGTSNQQGFFDKQRKQSNLSSDSRARANSPPPEQHRSSFAISEEDNRLSLIQTINKFDSEHPHGARSLINEMIKTYNNFSYIQEGLNTTHSRLLEEKARKQQEFQDQERSLEIIRRLNSYLDQMEKDKDYEKEMLSVPEAFDSGLLQIPQDFESLNGFTSHSHPNNNVFSTVNILKTDNFQSDNDKTKELVLKNQNFVFNFFSNYCESAIRICSILELIHNLSMNLCPFQLEQLSKSTIQFIKDIWAGKFDEMTESFSSKSGKKGRHNTFIKLGTQELLNGEEQPTIYFNHIQSEKFSIEDIHSLYQDIFKTKEHVADKFYDLLKSERIIWFFCNLEQIRNYLFEQKRKCGNEKGLHLTIDNIDQLKQQGIAIFENKLQNVMELMIKILQKVKESGHTSVKQIREIYPEYNPKRRHVQKAARENDEIREAKLKATLKSDNYFKNNDPLMEDFVVMKKEDNYNILLGDVNEQDKTKLQQQKKEDKNSDQINMLIDYIKKTKNNGQQIMIEHKKQQVQQMHKQKTKILQQQENNQQSQQANQGNGLNTLASQEGGPFHRNSNQSLNLAEYAQNSQQQQINSTNVNSSLQESTVKFYVGQQQKEDIYRFKQFNKVENEVIGKERERIHNLSKQKQIKELEELEKQLQQKNNKFFVSNEISEINERLHAENKAPFKEKLIRNFSESQLVLSKVDRMDRFSGFIGPDVVNSIQDEKSQMIRQLRGELYQPELNYLKSNESYNIRKQVAQEQIKYLHDQKLQQTVLLNNSHHSQSIQSIHSKSNNKNLHYSFNQDNFSKQTKNEGKQYSIENVTEEAQETANPMNQQLSHFHPLNHPIKITGKVLKRTKENEEKTNQKESLVHKMKEIKQVLKLPSTSKLHDIDSRPQTQGSTQRWSKGKQTQREESSKKKNNMTLSGQSFYPNKIQRPSLHDVTGSNKRINTPLSYNQFGFSDAFSSENGEMFNANNNNNNNQGPYNNQNLKFYHRYASPEGDAFFDQILNGPFFSTQNKRPHTQQANSRQLMYGKLNDQNQLPSNNFNVDPLPKPQSSHEGKRNQFNIKPISKPQQQQQVASARFGQEQDQIIEQEYYQQTYLKPEQNINIENQEQQKQVEKQEGDEQAQYNSNRQTDLYSTVSYSSSRTNNTHTHTNRPHHNQNHQVGNTKQLQSQNSQ